MIYSVQLYRDNDTGRERWAVLGSVMCVWYFPSQYGKKAATALANRLNRHLNNITSK